MTRVAHPGIGRFFAPIHALIALGIGAGGLVCAALAWQSFVDDHRISITFIVLTAGLLLVSPVYFVVQAFPQGCKTCKRAFADRAAVFPAGWREVVQRFLAHPDQGTWQQLCRAPMHDMSTRAKLSIEHCATCGKIGQALLVIEEQRDSDWSTRDFCERRVVEAPLLNWLLQIADARGGTTPRQPGW